MKTTGKKRYRVVVYAATMVFMMVLLLCFVSCRNTDEHSPDGENGMSAALDFTPVNLCSSHQREYCVIEGKSFFHLGKLSSERVLEQICADIPPITNKRDATVHGITTDGKYLYAYVRIFTVENDAILRRTHLYRIDPDSGECISLYDYEQPSVINNSFALNIFDDYLYFFIPNNVGYNEVCRIKTDGSAFEQLTDGNAKEDIYTGVICHDNMIYWMKNNQVYQTKSASLTDGELFLENVYTIEYYDDFLYYVQDSALNRINLNDRTADERCFENLYDSCYMIKENTIYYLKENRQLIGKNHAGEEVYNLTQATIYAYDIGTGISQPIYENPQLHITALYNINDQYVLASVQTNAELLAGNGEIQKIYLLPLDGGEPICIQDKRYA